MRKKIDYKGLLRTIAGSPKAFLLLVFGLGSVVWVIDEYWTQERTNWSETTAQLTDVQLNERRRNKEKEVFLKLTFDYTADNRKYQAYSEEILLSESYAEATTKELKETKNLITIYYKANNPAEATFDIRETKPDKQLLYVLIPTMIMIAALGYWGLKIRYEHYFKT